MMRQDLGHHVFTAVCIKAPERGNLDIDGFDDDAIEIEKYDVG